MTLESPIKKCYNNTIKSRRENLPAAFALRFCVMTPPAARDLHGMSGHCRFPRRCDKAPLAG